MPKRDYAGRSTQPNEEPPVVGSNQEFSAILGDSNELSPKYGTRVVIVKCF